MNFNEFDLNLDNAVECAKWFILEKKPVGERSAIFQQKMENRMSRHIRAFAKKSDIIALNKIFSIFEMNPELVWYSRFMNFYHDLSEDEAIQFCNANKNTIVAWLKEEPEAYLISAWIRLIAPNYRKLNFDFKALLVLYAPESISIWDREVEDTSFHEEYKDMSSGLLSDGGTRFETNEDGESQVVHTVKIDIVELLKRYLSGDLEDTDNKKTSTLPKKYECKFFNLIIKKIELLDRILTPTFNIEIKEEGLYLLWLKKIGVNGYAKKVNILLSTICCDSEFTAEIDLDEVDLTCWNGVSDVRFELSIEKDLEEVDFTCIDLSFAERIENRSTLPEGWRYYKRDKYWHAGLKYEDFIGDMYQNPSFKRIDFVQDSDIEKFGWENDKLNAIKFANPFEYITCKQLNGIFTFEYEHYSLFDNEDELSLNDKFYLSRDVDGFGIQNYDYSIRRIDDNRELVRVSRYELKILDFIVEPLVKQGILKLNHIMISSIDEAKICFEYQVVDNMEFDTSDYLKKLECFDDSYFNILKLTEEHPEKNISKYNNENIVSFVDFLNLKERASKCFDGVVYRYYWSNKLRNKVGKRDLVNIYLDNDVLIEITNICNELDAINNAIAMENWANTSSGYFIKNYEHVQVCYRIELHTAKNGNKSIAVKAYFKEYNPGR